MLEYCLVILSSVILVKNTVEAVIRNGDQDYNPA
jgi:hypothetical protein